MFSVNEVVNKHYPKVANRPWLSKSVNFALRHLLHEREISEFGQYYPHLLGIDFVEQVLEYFNVSYSVRDNEKERIPSQGRVVIIANHPIGSIDGLALIKLISEVRSDIKVVANEMLMAINSLHDVLLPVNNMQGGTAKECLRNIDAHLQSDGALLIFPAGEVSRLCIEGVRDNSWHSGFLRMANKAKAPILPIFIDAKNSPLFYGASMIYKPLSTLLLVKEMFKQRRKHLPMRIGELIPYESYNSARIALPQQVKLLKKHLYRIGCNKKPIFGTQKAIALPEERQALTKAIKKACTVLGETADGKLIYLYQHNGSSTIMREIGRLREVAFRAVGEGSNKRRDVDHFDSYYFHIILWDKDDLEIIGAYRLGDAKKLYHDKEGPGLYTSTLFDYNDDMLPYIEQGLELGRSFVQPQYWGKRSLDYLWYGIGAFLKSHPQYRYLFGPVSLSNSYPQAAKDLMVQFYCSHFGEQRLLARAKTPCTLLPELKDVFPGESYKQEFTKLKHLLANMGVTVPTLYKQYSELCEPGGVKFLSFNIDPDFNDCIDGLVLADVSMLKEKKRLRYIGD
ncbi:acyltransferase [Thalassotalea insulae]|uniref:L-ornithine N(alpha)-acyltransferase n=1 Tax=Thalassotalea insulae TaxID=2056778 RepID=A0ABQ6GWJ5_9GAMM|nr:GNAT family N-acyltransferase [Thalassotalea insulae]GLX80298.1 acyltransferase [Thalassotalea insulae]